MTFLAIIHIVAAIAMIFFVLLQDSKGAVGGVFGGGGSQSVFGASGATNILAKITRWIAILFAITCLTLSYLSTRQKSSVIDGYVPQNTPASQAPANGAAPTTPQAPASQPSQAPAAPANTK